MAIAHRQIDYTAVYILYIYVHAQTTTKDIRSIFGIRGITNNFVRVPQILAPALNVSGMYESICR